ncbi:MAG: ABC-type phosphate transport system substrate-binding protein [Colwellia sp.]|jgi:ABC-type phosphate transport system substrate-binding protein
MVLVMFFGSPATHAVVVITNITADKASITTTQLRRIYSMRQVRWSNDVPITIFVLSSTSTIHQKFCKETLRLFPYQLDRIWNKLTFSGMGVSPTIMESEEELIQAVKSTTGAIGYIENMDGVSDVNVLKIDE